MMYSGFITAPKSDAPKIEAAGFDIIERHNCSVAPDVFDFQVEGPPSALDAIEDKWGEWVWSLDISRKFLPANPNAVVCTCDTAGSCSVPSHQ